MDALFAYFQENWIAIAAFIVAILSWLDRRRTRMEAASLTAEEKRELLGKHLLELRNKLASQADAMISITELVRKQVSPNYPDFAQFFIALLTPPIEKNMYWVNEIDRVWGALYQSEKPPTSSAEMVRLLGLFHQQASLTPEFEKVLNNIDVRLQKIVYAIQEGDPDMEKKIAALTEILQDSKMFNGENEKNDEDVKDDSI